MIYISKDKTWDKASDEEKIAYCDELAEESKLAREKRDFEWYMNDNFINGNHYVYYNKVTKSIETPPRKEGEVRIVVNKVRSSIRAIENYSTRLNPKWEVMPGDTDDDTIDNARRAGKFLDFYYRTNHLKAFVKGCVANALNTSVAFAELDWDDKAANGLGDVRIRLHDSFDIFLDPRMRIERGVMVGKYLFKSNKRPIGDIWDDERYDKDNRKLVVPDEKLADASYKDRLLKNKFPGMDQSSKTATVREFLLFDNDKNEKGGLVTKFTYAGGQKLLEEPLDLEEFPIYAMQIPEDPNNVYHRSWTADAVPLNKALDRNISQKIMYVNKALVFRILAEKGHGINTITTDNGEILEINSGRKFEQFQMQPLPSALDSLTTDLYRFIEDTLGAHDAALGRMPTGARSGDMIEALQAADSNNLSSIRESLESFLSVLGTRVLRMAADKYTTARLIKITEPESDNSNYIKVIGDGAKRKPKDTFIITDDSEVIVQIGSWLGYTEEAKRQTIMEMARSGIIDSQEVLRQFEFPNPEALSERARKERLEKDEVKADIAGRRGGEQGQGGAQVSGQTQDKTVAIADKENTEMLNGTPVPPTEGAGINHTQAHIDFTKSRMFQDAAAANPDLGTIFQQHIQGELQMQGLG